MAFQNKVNQSQTLGFAGHIARASDSYKRVQGYVAETDITIGQFVQFGTKNGEVKQAQGVAVTGKIAGVAIFDKFSDGANDSAVVTKGNNVNVISAGSVYIETSLQATQGQAVLLKTADGTLAFDNDKAKTGYTFTGFIVAKGNDSASAGVIEITTAGAQI